MFDRELDAAATGPRWLADERVADVVIEALHYGARQLGLYDLRAWVLMENHVHIQIYPKASISRITKSIKNFSAKRSNAILGRTIGFVTRQNWRSLCDISNGIPWRLDW